MLIFLSSSFWGADWCSRIHSFRTALVIINAGKRINTHALPALLITPFSDISATISHAIAKRRVEKIVITIMSLLFFIISMLLSLDANVYLSGGAAVRSKFVLASDSSIIVDFGQVNG